MTGPERKGWAPAVSSARLLAALDAIAAPAVPRVTLAVPLSRTQMVVAALLSLGVGLWGERTMKAAGTNVRPDKPALAIINDILLPAMREVGDLFGAGKMQLPFVLKSAAVMKAAVDHLEPHLDRSDASARGSIVTLAPRIRRLVVA